MEPSQKEKSNNSIQPVTKVLWVMFSFFIVYGTLVPFELSFSKESISSNISSINWIPFMDPDGSRASIPDILQNILFFVPFGFLGFFSVNYRRKRRILIVTFLGSLLSLSVEILQIFTLNRTTSVSDLITNTVGTVIGIFAASFVSQIFPNLVTMLQFGKKAYSKYLFLLIVSLALVSVGSLQPFDFTLDVGFVWSKLKALINNPLHYTPVLRDEGVVLFRFILLGSVCVMWFQERMQKRPLVTGIAMSCFIGVFLEGCQLIIISRMPGIQDVVIVVSGSFCGGCLANLLRHNKIPAILWCIIVILATLFTAGMQSLSPFQLSAEYHAMNWVPFLSYYERTTFIALSNFIESVITYFPMGFLVQHLILKKKSNFFLIGIIAFMMAYCLEFSQGWIGGRYPDITDALGGTAGAVFGAWTNAKGWTIFNKYVDALR